MTQNFEEDLQTILDSTKEQIESALTVDGTTIVLAALITSPNKDVAMASSYFGSVNGEKQIDHTPFQKMEQNIVDEMIAVGQNVLRPCISKEASTIIMRDPHWVSPHDVTTHDPDDESELDYERIRQLVLVQDALNVNASVNSVMRDRNGLITDSSERMIQCIFSTLADIMKSDANTAAIHYHLLTAAETTKKMINDNLFPSDWAPVHYSQMVFNAVDSDVKECVKFNLRHLGYLTFIDRFIIERDTDTVTKELPYRDN